MINKQLSNFQFIFFFNNGLFLHKKKIVGFFYGNFKTMIIKR